jgi:NTP pyrophosphatase (non-canonical NTP hydrolase)
VTIQSEIYNAVKARGYLDETKWTREQLIVRQIFKMAEELGEAAEHVSGEGVCQLNAIFCRMAMLGQDAMEEFDADPSAGVFDGVSVDADELRAEIPDILIPLLVLAELLGVDVEQSARSKAESDIGRGVG